MTYFPLKRIYAEIRDTETGDLLGSNKYQSHKGVSDMGALITKAHDWYYSFQRGLSQGKNITLTIKIFDAEDASGLLDFK